MVELEIETTDNNLKIFKVKPYKISVRNGGIYFEFYNVDENKLDETLLELIRDINDNV